MDNTFLEKRDLGLATILKTENSTAVSYAQFNKDTGERIEDKVISFDIETLQVEKENCLKRVDEINTILVEIKNTFFTKPEGLIISEEII